MCILEVIVSCTSSNPLFLKYIVPNTPGMTLLLTVFQPHCLFCSLFSYINLITPIFYPIFCYFFADDCWAGFSFSGIESTALSFVFAIIFIHIFFLWYYIFIRYYWVLSIYYLLGFFLFIFRVILSLAQNLYNYFNIVQFVAQKIMYFNRSLRLVQCFLFKISISKEQKSKNSHNLKKSCNYLLVNCASNYTQNILWRNELDDCEKIKCRVN